MTGEEWDLTVLSFLVRVGFFLFGIYQDANFKVRYTDIDYFVFHDAAKYVYEGKSPYARDTYRYTPLLSWLLVPNHYFGWFHLGKVIFVIFDLVTGLIIMKLLNQAISRKRALILESIWLLNPMVITISTRGNAESVLCCLIMFTLFFLQKSRYTLAGILYGLSIHFKIYPIIYCIPIAIFIYYNKRNQGPRTQLTSLLNIGLSTLATLLGCGWAMYKIYGYEFLDQAYLYHLYRTDHRHNFSVWNMLLYLDSANKENGESNLSRYAFVPQLLLVLVTGCLEWWNPTFDNLLRVLFVQTFAFVTYNKVCTSQYFVWYLIFLPFYLSRTHIGWKKGLLMATLWVGTQGIWLSQGYYLEFEGKNVFYPGLFIASVLFFLTNVWLLGQFITDIKIPTQPTVSNKKNN
ncbi:Gpi14p [Saccharomyces cerevisiae YJM1273]|nr:Gpi14p [Saccharomyces cerevisiae YJM1434]AJV38768.1 Gpi14p [Saccharomyces cerevisiae YJM1273]CAI4553800.1 AVI_1a_G0029660.mRNA.1.CDS.1 [Saccharomyces cerevisiae]CAI4574604.1 ANE_G0029540.mRNA.1.CDS.1 [Saccharomyces cerevisiae]CAI6741754.1 ANE_G0029540.mRNA.1.CDS.1 [Saccharomyces cerevisiae]